MFFCTKQIVTHVTLVVVAALAITGAVWWFTFPRDIYVAGDVVSIEQTRFIVRDERGTEQAIFIHEMTVIRHGRQVLDVGPSIGDRVMVSGLPREGGGVEARVVRIFTSGNGTRPVTPVQ